jgi:dTDP-4-dehydrorhamnose reductase
LKRLGTVLLFGANGQVGQELLRALSPSATVLATTRSGHLADGAPCEIADFDQPETLKALLEKVKPGWVVNAAAYTAVDRAEVDREAAWRVNAEAPGIIARWCAAADVPCVHYSTDYVFDGRGTRPYREDDATSPLSEYGASKLAGEDAVRAAGGHHLILRTAWVYASHGSNFLLTMLRIGAQRDVLRVVGDQVGTPTPAALIADVTVQLMQRRGGLSGTWHLTARGQTTWHGFAEAIFSEAVDAGLLERSPLVEAISTAEYPTPVVRPAFSSLDTSRIESDFGIVLPDWQECLKQVVSSLPAGSKSLLPPAK